MIQPERVAALNARRERPGDYVLYWMQAAQRAEANHALEFAARRANDLGRPLVAFFGLTPDFPEAKARHYAFLLEGLAETAAALEKRGIRLIVRRGPPAAGAVDLARRACLAVVDAGCLRVEKGWRAAAAGRMDCPLIRVETNVIVPIRAASPKQEYSAATFRPKIYRRLKEFLVPLRAARLKTSSLGLDLEGLDVSDPDRVLAGLPVDRSVPPVAAFRGGASRARRRLRRFIAAALPEYAEHRNDPSREVQSGMSPYLHFGQISPLTVALEAMAAPPEGRAAFLEELIVRRELAFNYVDYSRSYDRFSGLPDWCRAALEAHAGDPREAVYSAREFETAATRDPYWNAAQTEMVLTGKMHGYMRMYWGKKILEWSKSPAAAFRIALGLNNAWEIDGRDPNGFAGVAWCFGLHDRPWGERPVYGTIRSMTAAGLERKFDIAAYVRRVESLAAAANQVGIGAGGTPTPGAETPARKRRRRDEPGTRD